MLRDMRRSKNWERSRQQEAGDRALGAGNRQLGAAEYWEQGSVNWQLLELPRHDASVMCIMFVLGLEILLTLTSSIRDGHATFGERRGFVDSCRRFLHSLQ